MASSVSVDNTSQLLSEMGAAPGNTFAQPGKGQSDKVNQSGNSLPTNDGVGAKELVTLRNEKLEESKDVEKEVESEQIEKAVEVIAEFMSLPLKNVNFLTDDSSDKTVIKVFDTESKELIKQFPSEEVLEIAQRILQIREDVGKKTGILLDEKV